MPGFCLLFIRLFARIEPIRNDTTARKMFAALFLQKNPSIHMDTRIGRSGGIRTHGIHIPNVARYQLRYTPIFLSSVFYCRAWRASGCHVSRCGGLGAALHRSHGCPALPPRCFRRWRRSATCTNCATPRYSFLLFFTTARGALPVAMCRAAAALARPCIARIAAQHFRLAVSAAGGARLRAPTALHPDIPFFCFLLPRVALLPSLL